MGKINRKIVAATICPTCGGLRRVSAKDLVVPNNPGGLVGEVIDVVAAYFDVDRIVLLSNHKTKDVVNARHVAMFFVRRCTLLSYPRMGEIFKVDQSSAQYACKRIRERMMKESLLYEDIQRLQQLIPKRSLQNP